MTDFSFQAQSCQILSGLTKRQILKGGLWGVAGLMAPSFIGTAHAARTPMPKTGTFNIAFRNTHTGESFSGPYRVGNKYLPDAFEDINNVLRDFRTGEVFPIDPRVMDILCSVKLQTGSSKPFQVLSGYRSPKTNAMLRGVSSHTGVAKNSLHLTGQAIDIRLPGVKLADLRDVGYKLKAGGVGYYPKSDFVHMDTGRVRHW